MQFGEAILIYGCLPVYTDNYRRVYICTINNRMHLFWKNIANGGNLELFVSNYFNSISLQVPSYLHTSK